MVKMFTNLTKRHKAPNFFARKLFYLLDNTVLSLKIVLLKKPMESHTVYYI